MYTIEQIQNGVVKYVEQELASKAVGVKKFAIYFILPTIKTKTVGYIQQFKPIFPEFFDSNGNVDLDKVYNQSKDAIRNSGQFEFAGIIFNETDIDRLYVSIKGDY